MHQKRNALALLVVATLLFPANSLAAQGPEYESVARCSNDACTWMENMLQASFKRIVAENNIIIADTVLIYVVFNGERSVLRRAGNYRRVRNALWLAPIGNQPHIILFNVDMLAPSTANEAAIATILAHEMAHIILGHTTPDTDAKDRIHEIEADSVAYDLATRAGYCPSNLVLHYTEHLDRFRDILDADDQDIALELISYGALDPNADAATRRDAVSEYRALIMRTYGITQDRINTLESRLRKTGSCGQAYITVSKLQHIAAQMRLRRFLNSFYAMR